MLYDLAVHSWILKDACGSPSDIACKVEFSGGIEACGSPCGIGLRLDLSLLQEAEVVLVCSISGYSDAMGC